MDLSEACFATLSYLYSMLVIAANLGGSKKQAKALLK